MTTSEFQSSACSSKADLSALIPIRVPSGRKVTLSQLLLRRFASRKLLASSLASPAAALSVHTRTKFRVPKVLERATPPIRASSRCSKSKLPCQRPELHSIPTQPSQLTSTTLTFIASRPTKIKHPAIETRYHTPIPKPCSSPHHSIRQLSSENSLNDFNTA